MPESTAGGLTFYPNPVKNVLHILNEDSDAKDYRILSDLHAKIPEDKSSGFIIRMHIFHYPRSPGFSKRHIFKLVVWRKKKHSMIRIIYVLQQE